MGIENYMVNLISNILKTITIFSFLLGLSLICFLTHIYWIVELDERIKKRSIKYIVIYFSIFIISLILFLIYR